MPDLDGQPKDGGMRAHNTWRFGLSHEAVPFSKLESRIPLTAFRLAEEHRRPEQILVTRQSLVLAGDI